MSDVSSDTMTRTDETRKPTPNKRVDWLARLWYGIRMPFLAFVTAFVLGGLLIWVTSGSFQTVIEAYSGLFRGAFTKQRGFSETLVATTPYILLSLGLAIGFKSGLFNIGVEGQFYIGAISAAYVGALTRGLPAIIHLPLTVGAGALGGAIWAGIPGYLKAKTGAHEVINTIMMNYIAFRLVEYLISGPLRDRNGTVVQTLPVSHEAELWTISGIPERLQNPLNALLVALIFALLAYVTVRSWMKRSASIQRYPDPKRRQWITIFVTIIVGLLTFFLVPLLTRLWWPFQDPYDRMHIGLFMALLAAVFVWWLLWRTTLGFELRTVGANADAARYAGINITRNVVVAMALSGAFAGIAGTVEVLGVSICRCLPLFFSSGYGFDSIAIALLAKNNPFGIVAGSFLFGAMRNGADLMELTSGVSKYIISVIQALVLLFVAAPAIVRWLYRIRTIRKGEEQSIVVRGWGG